MINFDKTSENPNHIVVGWRLSSVSGWGIYGQNLTYQLIRQVLSINSPSRHTTKTPTYNNMIRIFRSFVKIYHLVPELNAEITTNA